MRTCSLSVSRVSKWEGIRFWFSRSLSSLGQKRARAAKEVEKWGLGNWNLHSRLARLMWPTLITIGLCWTDGPFRSHISIKLMKIAATFSDLQSIIFMFLFTSESNLKLTSNWNVLLTSHFVIFWFVIFDELWCGCPSLCSAVARLNERRRQI